MQEYTPIHDKTTLFHICESFLAAPAVLRGKETIAQTLQEEDLREYFGNTLLKEIMPHISSQDKESLVIDVCAKMEVSQKSTNECLTTLLNDFHLHILPLLTENTNGLLFSLACITMLFAGAKELSNGYEITGSQGESIVILSNKEAMRSFSTYNCDMASESLAYAILSDVDIWGKNLRYGENDYDREYDFSRLLRDLQLLPVHQAITSLNQATKEENTP